MIINNFKNKKFANGSQRSGGYTLVELLFYISLFSVLTLLVINSMITMTKAFRETSIHVELTQSSAIIERISREIRNASAVTVTSASDITLNTTDGAGTAKTVQFNLSGTNVRLTENGTLTGNLNSPNITISALSFTEITTTEGRALKIFMTVSSVNDPQARSVDFYNTVVLRQSY
jgi:type II secretory pathway pseudopilin PulG